MNKNPYKIIPLDKYTFAPMVWLVMLYIATALTAGVDARPEGGFDLILFEARHGVIHLLAFAVEAWLIACALRLSGNSGTERDGIGLIVLALVLGIGQEALQSLYRHEVRVLASLWDVAVDATGGALGWCWHKHWRAGVQPQTFKEQE